MLVINFTLLKSNFQLYFPFHKVKIVSKYGCKKVLCLAQSRLAGGSPLGGATALARTNPSCYNLHRCPSHLCKLEKRKIPLSIPAFHFYKLKIESNCQLKFYNNFLISFEKVLENEFSVIIL